MVTTTTTTATTKTTTTATTKTTKTTGKTAFALLFAYTHEYSCNCIRKRSSSSSMWDISISEIGPRGSSDLGWF